MIDVANMSLQYTVVDDENCGLTNSDAFHLAVCNAYAAGVTLVSAAGNHASDASGTAPGTFEETINVSAFNDFDGLPGALGSPTCSKKFGVDDTFASYSNYGADIDISAPGTCVLSAWGNGKYNESTGTSMAAPHVTGGAALYLANHPYASPADVKSALLAAAAGESFPGDPDGTAEPRLNVANL